MGLTSTPLGTAMIHAGSTLILDVGPSRIAATCESTPVMLLADSTSPATASYGRVATAVPVGRAPLDVRRGNRLKRNHRESNDEHRDQHHQHPPAHEAQFHPHSAHPCAPLFLLCESSHALCAGAGMGDSTRTSGGGGGSAHQAEHQWGRWEKRTKEGERERKKIHGRI